jgi:hypothetical protein
VKITSETREWLLAAPEPYIRYNAQRLCAPETADASLLDDDPMVAGTVAAIKTWRENAVTRHDKPDLFFHQLAMLADLGVTTATTGVADLVEELLSNFAEDGTFPIPIMIPKVFGGTDETTHDWVICDLPVTVYALLRMGVDDPRLDRAVARIEGLVGEEFYPCCGSIPKFNGPGPRGGLCPYANLLVARALSVSPAARGGVAAKRAAEALLGLWPLRKEKKPFLFAMGTDFRKLKFPMVWYNLLHVVSALGPIDGVPEDPRFRELAALLQEKLDESGRATAESIYMVYKAHEWSNKKAPSRLMTILVHRALSGANA